jgi:hypothetical protein
MTDINEEQVEQLVGELNNLPLDEPQRTLLDAILFVVAEIRETDEGEGLAFTSEFTHAFKKAQADLVLEYVDASSHGTGHIITRGMTSPPMIARRPPTPPGP